MDEKLKQAIEKLLAEVENVIGNGDWPTENGHLHDDGVSCTCPLLDQINFIRKGIS
jgi:hypothetical protein